MTVAVLGGRVGTTSLGVKREIVSGLALSVDGVYSRGYNQYAWNDLNYPDPVTGVRPDPTRGRVIEYADYGNSGYSALLVGLEQRQMHGAAWSLSYTLSKTLRDVEGFQFTPQDMRNPAGDKSLASNHRKHQLVGNVTYRLPWGFQLAALRVPRGIQSDEPGQLRLAKRQPPLGHVRPADADHG